MIKGSLIDDLRCEVEYTDKPTMPIPLYERVKSALIAIDDALYQQQDDMIETITEILRKP